MKKKPKLELVSYTDHSQPFLGLCDDVKVAIREFKIRDPIFDVKDRDHDFVLSHFFLNSMKFCQEYKPNGRYSTIMHPHMHQTAFFCTITLQNLIH